MKIIYDDKVRKDLNKRIVIHSFLTFMILFVYSFIIYLSLKIINRSNIYILTVIFSIISLIIFVLSFAYVKFYLMYYINMNKFIKRVSLRKEEELTGILVNKKDSFYTMDKLSFKIYTFDFGDIYHEEKIYVDLYIERSIDFELKLNQKYTLTRVDNAILKIEEV